MAAVHQDVHLRPTRIVQASVETALLRRVKTVMTVIHSIRVMVAPRLVGRIRSAVMGLYRVLLRPVMMVMSMLVVAAMPIVVGLEKRQVAVMVSPVLNSNFVMTGIKMPAEVVTRIVARLEPGLPAAMALPVRNLSFAMMVLPMLAVAVMLIAVE